LDEDPGLFLLEVLIWKADFGSSISEGGGIRCYATDSQINSFQITQMGTQL